LLLAAPEEAPAANPDEIEADASGTEPLSTVFKQAASAG